MPLDRYRQKRDFTKSPEPSGDAPHRSPSGRKPRFFCVQKHLASHLHYDFRLEHDGVLLSWAVPKGPSLDPATKRLAMHVEDHPIDYGSFEGVIPSGYGAGIVMLWDVGTWTPESDDVDAALAKGDFKFSLDGYKLKGSWVLVRTKGGPGQRGRGDGARSWLLIKHRDDWAGEVDIAAFAPLSVKSKGDFADILSNDNPEIWISNRPAEGGETGALFKRIIEQALAMRATAKGTAPPGRIQRSGAAAKGTLSPSDSTVKESPDDSKIKVSPSDSKVKVSPSDSKVKVPRTKAKLPRRKVAQSATSARTKSATAKPPGKRRKSAAGARPKIRKT